MKNIDEKIRIIICICICLFLALTVSVCAHGSVINSSNPYICVDRVMYSGDEDTIDVNVTIQNNPGITSVRLKLEYDETNLELAGITNGTVFSASNVIHSTDLSNFGGILMWNDAGSHSDNMNNGVLVTLTFRLKSGCTSGTHNINVSYAGGPDSIYNTIPESVAFDIYNGYIFTTSNDSGWVIFSTRDEYGKMTSVSMYQVNENPTILDNQYDQNLVYILNENFEP